MKKLLATLLASTMALTTIGGLVACGGDETPGGGKGGGELKPSDFSQVTHWDDPMVDKGDSDAKVAACNIKVWAPELAIETYQTLVDQFKSNNYHNGKYANVEVTFQVMDEGNVKTELGKDATQAADIFFFPSDHTQEMIRNNWLLPLRGGTGSYYSAAIAQRDDEGAAENVHIGDYYYAFPATNDNGYYLLYSTEDLTAEEADDLDKILEKATAKNKTFTWNYPEGFWAADFFFGVGITPDWKGAATDFSEFAGAKGTLGAQATIKYVTHSKMTTTNTGSPAESVLGGYTIATVCGTWESPTAEQLATGKIAVKKLPMFTTTTDNTGTKYQMGAFYGGKYCGISPSTKNPAVAMALANYLTNGAAQDYRFDQLQTGPSNTAIAAQQKVKDNVTLNAYLSTVEAGGVFQGDVPQSFWDATGQYTKDAYAGKVTLANLKLGDFNTLLNGGTVQE